MKNALLLSGDLERYRSYQNKLSALTQQRKRIQYWNVLNNNLNNMKNTWSDVNQFLSKQKRNSKPITTLNGPDTGATTTSGPEHANIRNKNFSSSGDNLANTCNIVPSNNHFPITRVTIGF